MSIPPFSFFLIFYVLFVFYKVKELKKFFLSVFTLTLIVSTFVRMGYFFLIGDKIFLINSFLIYLTGSVAIIEIVKNKCKLINFSLLIVVLFFLTLSCLSSFFLPYDKLIITNFDHYLSTINNYIIYSDYYSNVGHIKIGNILTLSFSFISVFFFLNIATKEILKKIFFKMLYWSKINVLYGLAECLNNNLLHSDFFISFSCGLFGRLELQHDFLVERGGLYLIQGLCQEASMYTFVLFYSSIIFLLSAFCFPDKKNTNLYLALTIFLFLVNPAFSGFVFLFLFIIIFYFCFYNVSNRKFFLNLFLCLTLMCGFLFILFIIDSEILNRIREMFVIINKYDKLLQYSSSGIRFIGIYECFRYFLDNPFLGVGLGLVNCDSALCSSLACLGAGGTLCLLYFIYRISLYYKFCFRYCFFFLCTVVFPNVFLNSFECLMLFVLPFILVLYNIFYLR